MKNRGQDCVEINSVPDAAQLRTVLWNQLNDRNKVSANLLRDDDVRKVCCRHASHRVAEDSPHWASELLSLALPVRSKGQPLMLRVAGARQASQWVLWVLEKQ